MFDVSGETRGLPLRLDPVGHSLGVLLVQGASPSDASPIIIL